MNKNLGLPAPLLCLPTSKCPILFKTTLGIICETLFGYDIIKTVLVNSDEGMFFSVWLLFQYHMFKPQPEKASIVNIKVDGI